jgi:hypothetical protein
MLLLPQVMDIKEDCHSGMLRTLGVKLGEMEDILRF